MFLMSFQELVSISVGVVKAAHLQNMEITPMQSWVDRRCLGLHPDTLAPQRSPEFSFGAL